MKRVWGLMAIISIILVLTGCGGKSGFTIFIIDNQGDPSVISEQLQANLQQKLGEEPKVEVVTSAMYDVQKILVEYAAGGHDIFILPEADMKQYGNNGSNVSLDDTFDQEKYERGVFEGGVFVEDGTGDDGSDIKKETHLYGIPLEDMKMFQEVQYAAKNLFATIPVSASNIEESKKVLKALTE
ncbi:hypothetical protein ASD24_09045 [Paenibacillus sp. Root52]|uniref:Lipoprotein n=1 Tax=Paenibacillus amylolyticus TaxID=1451 RepID=A0AAP5HA53_PAEAM|nr:MULTISPECIES: hypothetical protein [Paenibacillus]KQY83938.1 hypothetical protein ASD24_09045 [Paenibacillus sp. Root52]MCG7378961.1 hypothetical protein [Paenibacillus sp. ACRSA]MDR6726614.1 hypothetical protein [Paenibacillus amylolyticus]